MFNPTQMYVLFLKNLYKMTEIFRNYIILFFNVYLSNVVNSSKICP